MSSKKKELTLEETFYNLCKDLIRYIDKKIVRKYVSPNQAQIPKEKRNKEIHFIDNKWRYFFEDEETTEEERIKDIFKDNNFLSKLQNLYDDLNVITKNMEQNKTDKENLDKKNQIQNEQMKLLGDINMQLAKYFMEHNKNINSINKNDLIKALEEFKKKNSIENLNPEIIHFYINNMSKAENININNDISKKEEKEKEPKNSLINNENINNHSDKLDNQINIKDEKNNQIKNNNAEKKNVFSSLIQAFDIVNKNKKKKIKEEQKDKLIKNIFESDSNDSIGDDDEEEYDEEEEEEDDEDEDNKNNNKINITKNNHKNNENETTNKLLNKKVKRNNE